MKIRLGLFSPAVALRRTGMPAVVLSLLVPVFAPSSQAANTSHTLTTTGANNLSTATWTGGAPTNLTIGDMAIYNTAATASTTTIDVNTSLGGFRANNTGVWTISAGAGTLTLDATGLTAGNSPFGNAGVAFLANTSTAAGGLTVNSNLVMTNTDLDIGTTNTGSIIVGGNITASSAQSLNFRANNTGVITDTGNIGATGSNIAISNLGTAAGTTTLSGILGTSVTTVTQNSATSALTLSGANLYSGGTTLTAGTLQGNNALATNVLTSFGTGTVALNGGTLQLRANGTGNTQTIVTGNGVTGNNVTIGGTTTIDVNRNATSTGNTFQFNNLSIGANTLNLTGGNTYGLQFAGTTTLTGNATFNATTAPLTLTGAIGDGGSAFGFTKLGAGNLTISGASTYTGATTIGASTAVTSAATTTLNGASGSIATSSGVSIFGNGSKLTLDNSTTNNNDRIGNNVTLGLGAELQLTGNGAVASTTESFGALGFGSGGSIVTVTGAGALHIQSLSATSLSRTGNGTGYVRGTNLGSGATGSTSLALTTIPSGSNFVGAGGAAAGAGATKNLAIVPWLLGDTNAAGAIGNSGTSGLVTYDTTTASLRPLVAGEYDTLNATYATQGNNVTIAVAGPTTFTGAGAVNQVWNALLFGGQSNTLVGVAGTTLTINSGVIASATNLGQIINGFDSINLGNGEGVITTGSASTTTLGSLVNVSSGGGITKTGGGTLAISNSNIGFTGAITINQGTFALGTFSSNGSVANNIVGNGGNLSFTANGTNTFSGNLSGASLTVTQGTSGSTLVLSGANTYSGATSITNGTLQFNGSSSMSSNSVLSLSNTGTTDTGAIKLALRSDTDATFTPGASGNINLLGNGAIGQTVYYNIDVNNLTSGTGRTLTLGSTVNAGNGATNGIAQINVTGGNGYTLALGNYNQSSNNGNGAETFNVASGVTLTLARIIGAGQSSNANFAGAGNTSILGAIGKDANTGRNLFLNFNQTGTVTLNAAYGPGVSDNPNFNNGTVVYNNAAATSNSVLNIGTVTNAAANANNVNVLLGGGTGGLTGGLTYTGAIVAEDGGASFLNTGTLSVGGQNTSGTNTFSNANTVTLGATANVGRSLNLVSATGGQVDFTGVIRNNGTDTTAGITINSPVVINAVTTNPGGTVRLAGANTYRGTTTIAGGTLLADSVTALNTTALGGNVTFTGGSLRYGTTFAAGANADISNRIKNSTGAISVDTNGQAVTYASALDGSNTGGLTKLGAGTQTLTGTNTYSGTTTITGGTLQLGNGTTGNDGTIANSTSIVNNANLTYNRFGSTSYGGVISGTGTVTKLGAGTQTLTGANTYTGGTTITGGTLQLGASGSVGSPVISVGAGAVYDVSLVSGGYVLGAAQSLSGLGTVNGAVTSNGTIGNTAGTIGTLTFSNALTLNTGAVLDIKFNSTLGTFDRIVAGALTLNANTLNLTDLSGVSSILPPGTTYTLVQATSIAGMFTGYADGSTVTIGNNSFLVSYAGNNFTLTTSAIPEPATYAAILGALALAGVVYKRRRSV